MNTKYMITNCFKLTKGFKVGLSLIELHQAHDPNNLTLSALVLAHQDLTESLPNRMQLQ